MGTNADTRVSERGSMKTTQISNRLHSSIAGIASTIAILALPLAAAATEYQTVDRPRQECWNEQVPVQAAGQGYGGAIVGGIAGGILGNQVGGGNGKTIATAVGAMTGAVVGDRMSAGSPSYQTVQRCRTVMDHVQVPVMRQRVEVIQAPPVPVIRQRVEVIQAPPVPVVEERVYYVERHGPPHHHGHGYWKHHRHDDDDRDD